MASGIELATAYLTLVPSLRGAQRNIQSQLGPIAGRVGNDFTQDFDRATSDIGQNVSSNLEDNAGGDTGKSTGLSFAKGFVLAGGALITAGLAKAIQSGAEQEVSTDKLAASLGANEKQSARLGKIAGSLYSDAFGESFSDVTDSIGAVKVAFRGLGGKELERVTGLAISFANVFETDVPTSINAAKAAVTQGLAKNVTEALDLFTVTGTKVGKELLPDVQDAVTEYGSFFNQLGFGGPKAFSLLAAGASKGAIGIDKTGDAIAEFTKLVLDPAIAKGPIKQLGLDYRETVGAIAKGGAGARDAFDKIVTGLGNIDDPAKRARQAIALFGTPIEDLNATQIPGFLTSLKKGQAGFKDFQGATQKASDTIGNNATASLTKFKRGIEQGLTEAIGGKAIPALTKAADYLNANFGPAVNASRDFIVKYQDVLVPVAAAIGAVVVAMKVWKAIIIATTAVQTALNIVLTANPIGLIVLAIAGLAAGLFVAYKKSETFRKVVDTIFEALKKFAGFIKNNVLPIIFSLASAWLKMAKFGIDAFRFLLDAAFGAFEGILSAADKGLGWIPGLGDKIGKAKESFSKFRDSTANALESLSTKVGKSSDALDRLAKPRSTTFTTYFVSVGTKNKANRDESIAGYASGTKYAPGGLALVGENGPELVTLPRGSRVDTAVATKRIASDLSSTVASGDGGRAALTITNWAEGTGFIRYLAADVVGTASDMHDERSRATWIRT